MSINVTDKHIASQYRILDTNNAIIYDSGEITSNLTSFKIPANSIKNTNFLIMHYRIEVRYKSEKFG